MLDSTAKRFRAALWVMSNRRVRLIASDFLQRLCHAVMKDQEIIDLLIMSFAFPLLTPRSKTQRWYDYEVRRYPVCLSLSLQQFQESDTHLGTSV